MREQHMRRASYFLLTLACGALCPAGAQAQDAPYRPALAQLRAALDSTRSELDVDRVAAEWAVAGNGPTRRLGQAYIQLRRGTLDQERTTLVAAWDEFEQVVTGHPDWPYARFGLAMAGFQLYNRHYSAPALYDGMAGGTHYDGVAIQLSRMLQDEPGFQPGVDWVASTLASEGDRAQRAPVVAVLRFIADSTASTNPGIQLILARADRLDGDTQRSLDRIDSYLREGGDSGIAALERARSLAALDSLSSAASSYMSGTAIQTAAARDIYRLDLSWVATELELSQYDRLAADSVTVFVQRFWAKRDARELRPAGSRLQEHLRRWVYVSQNFRVDDPGRRTMLSQVRIPNPNESCASGKRTLDDYSYVEPTFHDYRSPERVFDHRATVYMRHGEPLYQFSGDTTSTALIATTRGNTRTNGYDEAFSRVAQPGMAASSDPIAAIASQYPGAGTTSPASAFRATQSQNRVMNTPTTDPRVPTAPYTAAYADRNVTWVYNLGGQIRAFTFQGHEALGTSHPSTLIVGRAPNLDVLLQVGSYSESYIKLANAVEQRLLHDNMIPLSCTRAYRDVIREQQEGAAVAVRTDSYERRFKKPISSMIQVAAMGQPSSGTGEVLVAVGVKMNELEEVAGTSNGGKAGYIVRVELAAIDSIRGEVISVDTVRRFLARREQSGWLSFVTTMPLRPGLAEFHMSVSQGDERGVVQAVILDPASGGFSASDIVLGTASGPASWLRDGATVSVNPYNAYRTDDALSMYQELYGLTPGMTYRTMVSLREVKKGKKAKGMKVALNFEETAATPTLATSRELALDNVKPGLYDLLIDVEEVSTGRTVHRERSIAVYAKP